MRKLISDSAYVLSVLLASVSIPTEIYIIDLETIDVFTIKVTDGNVSVNFTDVLIDINPNTNGDGSGLDGVDVMLIKTKTERNGGKSKFQNCNNGEGMSIYWCLQMNIMM